MGAPTRGRKVSRETFGAPLTLTPQQRHQLDHFEQLVSSHAIRAGLVGFAKDDVRSELNRSLLLLEVISGAGPPGALIDVGSGAGFPGIPLAVVLGGAILVEPRRRAVGFLEKVRRETGIDFEIRAESAQEAAETGLTELGGTVVSRAVAVPARALELCAPLCSQGGHVILTASEGSRLDLSNEQIEALGIEEVRTLLLGDLEMSQWIHMMVKTRSTSSGA